MYKALCALVALLITEHLHSQNSLLRDNEFVINPYAVSPSYSGFNGNHEIFASYLNHFSGVPQAPNSAWVNYNGIAKKNFGIGAEFRYERYGAFRNIKAYVSAAYHAVILSDHKLSVGLGFSAGQQRLNFSNSNSDPLNDGSLQAAQAKSGVGLNAAVGITYAWKALNISVSVPNLIPIKADHKRFLYSAPVTARGYASYNFVLSRTWSLKPQVIVDYAVHTPVNYCAVVTVKYDNLVFLNLGYGAGNIISGGLGTTLAQRFTCQYTFKYGVSGIAHSPYGNHEIVVGVLLGKIKQVAVSNTIFSKRSKSPYHDWE